ncbi:DUF445 domain-containing protein [Agitococcus lubricus]|uniref:Uncharacterized membrane-anchored protein YjiN (DUF445 family) n=1 Tax=Agitococcus lubricus TaxID=1077255 RepID=A0A2T5J2M9_9GAMM|nr:DUF445 domain-containing protein [Agitococcus lubricus]PTQ90776.1 uncharacterized membrane-anchored protein YjiN (DUF445 family) [Agitococcus lubricus]
MISNQPLEQRQMVANIALITAAAGFAIQPTLVSHFPAYSAWMPHVKMAFEAALVGGLADWFAVTAIFRRPLNLPIPHTAIIPNNQDRIAATIGVFVQSNFLTDEAIRRSCSKQNIAGSVASWLEKEANASQLAHEIGIIAPRILQFFRHHAVESFVQRNVVEWVRASSPNTMTAQMLQAIFNNGNHQQAFQFVLEQTDDWLKHNPDKASDLLNPVIDTLIGPILSRVRASISNEAQGVVSLIVGGIATFAKPETRKAADQLRANLTSALNVEQKIIDGLINLTHEIRNDPNHIFRIKLDEVAKHYIGVLSVDSPESRRLNAFKDQMINNPDVVKFFSSIVISIREAIQKDLNSVKPAILISVRDALMMLGRNLAQDEQFQKDLNQGITDALCFITSAYSDAIIDFIGHQVRSWDSEKMVREVEKAIGADLQMIRLNGTLVGGLIGLVLSFLQ